MKYEKGLSEIKVKGFKSILIKLYTKAFFGSNLALGQLLVAQQLWCRDISETWFGRTRRVMPQSHFHRFLEDILEIQPSAGYP